MSENSSDSDSSCGWTIISPEGSDPEMLTSVQSADSCKLGLEELLELHPRPGGSSQDDTSLTGEAAGLAVETEEERSPEDNVCFGAASDDSDIVTLEPPKLEEIGSQDTMMAEEMRASGDFSMGSSSSSQYTFCGPETAGWWAKLWKIPVCIRAWDAWLRRPTAGQRAPQVFSSEHGDDGSSSEEAGDQPSPAFRRRRPRRKVESVSDSEERPPADLDPLLLTEPQRRQPSGCLHKCVLLAMVIAVSMGLGHFYGAIQSERWQQLVPKTPANGASDAGRQGSPLEVKTLKESLGRCRLLTTAEKMALETQTRRLAAHSHHLRASLEQGEQTTGSLQEELRKLREQIRILEGRGAGAELILENQKLKQHLHEAKQKTHRFLNQREILLAETKMLRSELEREQKSAASLRREILHLQAGQRQPGSGSPHEKETAELQERLAELEQRLSFEQQRSDLWERLYIEARDQNGKPDTGKQKAGRGNHRAKSKSKETLLGTVKETFDAMKNSTKEFVRHHKEKIKQAKEAVKENLKRFSDSVKSTFRHFKDTTKTIFEKGNKRFGTAKEADTGKKKTVFSGCSHPQHEAPPQNQNRRSPSMQGAGSQEQQTRWAWSGGTACLYKAGTTSGWQGACRSSREAGHRVPGTARQFFSPCDTVASPALAADFRQVIRRYLVKELDTFHHWEELNEFIDQCIIKGLTSQKTFADFVNDVIAHLKSMEEYRADSGVFEKLDGYICRHFADRVLPLFGPSRPDKKQRMVNIENSRHGKQEQKHLQSQPCKREGKWHKCGRTSRRHMANLEIELGQLPFDSKY
ncbi:cell cycle progression protein 1 isoform X4 [Fukomys damarensis]|nr:cell cycle progression protein 1 isoform X4 [Fukomys damarensis]